MIYFIQSGDDGPIKIGYSKSNSRTRLRTLQTGSAEKLTLLCEREGHLGHETALHHKLSEYRLDGEWFRPADQVLAAMKDPLPDADAPVGIGVAQPNPDVLDRPDLGDRQVCYEFARELVRQIVQHHRSKGASISEALDQISSKRDLGSYPKRLWQGGRAESRLDKFMRLFTEWLHCIHPDLEPYAQQIMHKVSNGQVFTGKKVWTDTEARELIGRLHAGYAEIAAMEAPS